MKRVSGDNYKKIIRDIQSKNSNYWMKRREINSLSLFHSAATRVPAYKDFLKKNNVNVSQISSWVDFQKVPTIDKENYLRKYSLQDKCWDGDLAKPGVLTATSGSTGQPVYFLRDECLDLQYSVILELFLRRNKLNMTEPALVLVCFGMGLWIAGVITYKGFELAAKRNNFPLSIITPGINKSDIFNALKNLSSQYKQIVFAGYPPFIKDVIDEVREQNIDLNKANIKILFAAEAISEEFRNYIAEKANIDNPYTDIINIYGSADIGAMAFETGAATLIKKKAKENNNLFKDIFSTINKTPTLAQFIPDFINFESVNGELLLTGDSFVPLVRYAIGDNGGVLGYQDLATKLKSNGVNLKSTIVNEGLTGVVDELPFVYVYERKDLSATFYGLLIYPEWIRPALLERKIRDFVSGKFTLVTRYDQEANQSIEVNIELRKGIEITDLQKEIILERIVNCIQKYSSEYRELVNNLKEKAYPQLSFWSAEDPLYFAPGSKQKWVLKTQ